MSYTELSLAHFVGICHASHNCITGVIQGVQRDELLLDFFSSPLGTGFLSAVSNVTVFLSLFFFFLKIHIYVGITKEITAPTNV